MLSDLFQREIARLADQSVSAQQRRDQRDAFILAQFPLLDASFAAMIDATVGLDSHLTVDHISATDTFMNHNFASLNKTITVVQSTLYGTLEKVIFTPALESRDSMQFGVIGITTDSLPESIVANPGRPVFSALLQQGIFMRGATAASLVVPLGAVFTSFDRGLLESFLSALFIRR